MAGHRLTRIAAFMLYWCGSVYRQGFEARSRWAGPDSRGGCLKWALPHGHLL